MKISVIIPIYNVEPYIVRCAESVFRQDLSESEYEVIFVNDGSKDRSMEMLQNFLDTCGKQNFKVVNKKNGGLSSARNVGIEHANGDYLWFVDSDDWIEPNCLGTIQNRIKETCTDIIFVYADDIVGKKKYIRGKYENYGVIGGKEYLLKYKRYNCAQFYIVRKILLNQHDIRFYEGIMHEDNEYSHRMLYHAQSVTNVKGVFYHFFRHEGSITTTPNPKKLRDLILIAHNYVRYADDIPQCDRHLFYNVVGNNVNQAMFECEKYDNDVKNEINKLISDGDFAKYLVRSSIMKYKVEGLLFYLFPAFPLKIYDFLQTFNSDKGGQKKAIQYVVNL